MSGRKEQKIEVEDSWTEREGKEMKKWIGRGSEREEEKGSK